MAKMDVLGRVGVPQALRKRYGINEAKTEVEITDNGDGILIKPKKDVYTLTAIDMKTIREVYIMLKEYNLLDSYNDEVLSRVTKKSESVCSKCGSNLFLNNDNTLKCYKCK